MQDPQTIRIVHEHFVREELQRNFPEHYHYFSENVPARSSVAAARQATARILYTLSERIAPDARPIDTCLPASTKLAK